LKITSNHSHKNWKRFFINDLKRVMSMKQSATHLKKIIIAGFIITFLLITDDNAYAGGPWVLGKGQVDLSLGFSRKVGKERWQVYHLDPNGTPKNLNDDVDSFALVSSPDSATVDGKFHDFRYYYFQGVIGIAKNLELDWTINWLEGRESQTRDPKTGSCIHTTILMEVW
jgi:hypothetical protein